MDAFRPLTYFRMKDAWQGNSILKGLKVARSFFPTLLQCGIYNLGWGEGERDQIMQSFFVPFLFKAGSPVAQTIPLMPTFAIKAACVCLFENVRPKRLEGKRKQSQRAETWPGRCTDMERQCLDVSWVDSDLRRKTQEEYFTQMKTNTEFDF